MTLEDFWQKVSLENLLRDPNAAIENYMRFGLEMSEQEEDQINETD